MVKNLSAKCKRRKRHRSLFPGSWRSLRVGNGHLLQYSCLEDSMDSRAWWATYSSWGYKESDPTEQLNTYKYIHTSYRTQTYFDPFLHNKLSYHLEAKIAKHLLSNRFYSSEIQEQITWWHLRFCYEVHSVLAEAAVISRIDWGGSKLIHMTVGKSQKVCFQADFCGTHHRAASWHGRWLSPEWAIQNSERVSQMKITVFYYLISELTSHHFSCILLMRSESKSPDHS